MNGFSRNVSHHAAATSICEAAATDGIGLRGYQRLSGFSLKVGKRFLISCTETAKVIGTPHVEGWVSVRDDFTKATVDLLAKRAGYLCSNPDCNLPTVGAAPNPDKAMMIGVAAHITAASPGGPRYNPSFTPQERGHAANGIWLCGIHGKAVDSDAEHFTVEMLRKWKQQAEENSLRTILTLSKSQATRTSIGIVSGTADLREPEGEISSILDKSVTAAKVDLEAFKRGTSWPAHAISLNLRINDGKVTQTFKIAGLAAASQTFNEIVVVAAPGTGKTTTLLQLTETILSRGDLVAVFIPLGEWSSRPASLFQSVTNRHAFGGMTEQELRLLGQHGRIVLILDGWNELDGPSRRRAGAEVNTLRREFPSLSFVVSTRRQALDVPVAGPLVEVETLTADQQLEIAGALKGSEGEAVLDHAWRTAGIRDLVGIPLYLTTLLANAPGSGLPTTKEEVLRLVSDHYQHRGLGTDLLRRLVEIAREEKLTRVNSEMLRENLAMQTLAKKLGFSLRLLEGPTSIRAFLDL